MPELGIDVESVRGRGHRIPGGLELLDEQRVLEQLQPEAARALSGIEILDSVDSTNRHLLERIAQQPSHGHVCSAEDRKSTRLNSSHVAISYAVSCSKKKTIHRP